MYIYESPRAKTRHLGHNYKKVRVEKIQIFSDLKKIYSGLQIEKIEKFYDPQKNS